MADTPLSELLFPVCEIIVDSLSQNETVADECKERVRPRPALCLRVCSEQARLPSRARHTAFIDLLESICQSAKCVRFAGAKFEL